jgi:hypothetical protein
MSGSIEPPKRAFTLIGNHLATDISTLATGYVMGS